ncbi:MAG TPA: AsmA-like C-terminal region-containing protein [Nitrospira sp.]
MLLVGVVAASFWLWFDAASIQEWAAEKASAAIGKRVTIGGPVRWALSLNPTIVFKQVAISEDADRGSSDFVKAGTVEVSVALLPLLHRSVVIPSLAISDLEVVFRKEAGDQEAGNTPPAQDNASKPIGPAVQIHTISLHRASATFYSVSAEEERVVLHEARLDADPDQPVRLVASGEFRNVPVALEATGGPLSDLIGARSEWWPVSLAVQTPGVSLQGNGRIGLPFGPRVDAQLTMSGEYVNALNRLFAVELPALGPYSLSGKIELDNGKLSATNMKATLGTSDLTGDVFVQYTGRQRLSANLASQRLDANDFSAKDGATDSSGHADPTKADGRVVEWLRAWEVDLGMASQTVVIGGRALGSIRLQAGLETGFLHLSVPAAHVLGMRVHGHADLDVRQHVPTVSMVLTARGLDPGIVFSSLSDDFVGIADVTFRAEARGLSRQDLLSSLDLSLHTNRTTLLFRDPLSEHDVTLLLDDGQASLNSSGGRMRMSGRYGIRSFQLEAESGPLSSLSSNIAWPIRVGLQTTQAHLLVHGTVRLPLNRESVVLEIRGQGRSLDEFGSSFPAIGPFQLSGHVTSDGRQSWVGHVAGQIGQSDADGRFDMAMQGDRLAVTAGLTSRTIRTEDFRNHAEREKTRGNSASGSGILEAPGPPRNLRAHVTWHIDRFQDHRFSMKQLALEASADSGRLEVSSSAIHPHGKMDALLVLDGAVEIPTLNVRAHSKDFDYGALLRDLEVTDRVVGTTELVFDLTSGGRTIEELVDRVAFRLTAQPRTWHISTARNDAVPISLVTATLSSRMHEPVVVALQGKAKNVPISMTVTSMPVKEILGAPSHLPWTLVLRGPDVLLEAQGRAGFQVARGSADFHMSLNGTSLSSLIVFFYKDTPGLPAYRFNGDVSVRDQKLTLSDFHVRIGKSDIGGGLQIAWDGPRLQLKGSFSSEFIEPKILETLSSPIEVEAEGVEEPLRRTVGQEAEKAATTAQSIGEGVVDFVSPVQLPLAGHAESEKKVIPDWALPIQSFHSADVDFYWTLKRLLMPPVEMDDVIAMLTMKDGMVTAGPLQFGHHGAMTTGRLTLDGAAAVPHAGVEITTTNFDYGGMLKAFRISNMVEGSADLSLSVEGNGRSLRELASTANGSLDIVAGPAKVASRFVELWASNLMIAMLSHARHREPFSQYHCAAANIEIHDGEMKTDSFLIEASDHSVAAAGTLNLGTEELDMVMTPRPKDLAVLSLAAPIRLTGPLAGPKVSTNVQSIAASKAWQVLDVADPIGLALLVPRVMLDEKPGADHSIDNPCRLALRRGGKETLSTQKVVRGGFNWFADLWRTTGSTMTRLFQGQPAAASDGEN